MKKITGSINSILLTVYVPETLGEFKEGARLLSNGLDREEGILFNFGKKQSIQMENGGVDIDLRVLYFNKFSKCGIVQEAQTMKANTYGPYQSTGVYSQCLELSEEFCEKFNIKEGAVLILHKVLDA